MNGQVDSLGRALVKVSIRATEAAKPHDVQAWIDTGFNGDLVLPQQQVDNFRLRESGTVKAVLADGSEISVQRYVCLIDWFGERRELEVIANSGEYPLLGVGLLMGFDLRINYRSGEIMIE